MLSADDEAKLKDQFDSTHEAGRLQDAFYLLFFAMSGIVIALTLNWRNDRQGYWMNGILIAFADIPFVVFVLVPGLVPWWPGLAGPLLWSVAFAFTTIGRFAPLRRKHAAAKADAIAKRLSDTIADFVVGLDPKSLPPLAIERARLAFIDMLAGSREEGSEIVCEMIRQESACDGRRV
jgi:hypothetical protein